ncbi:transposable element Tcb1 transposase [Trichonephila clavipes]|nr:transposable element Tcb1 transposase [Trichonephila clavipes]
MWSMVAQRLTQITPPAATPDQLWQRVEAGWSAVPQEHIQSLFESMPRCVAAQHTTPTAGVIVWGAIAYNTRSPLELIRGTVTAQWYVHVLLQPHVLPLMKRLPGAIFQQDIARLHTARVSQDCLRTVTNLPWPARSPDLSPIEHIWDHLGRRVGNPTSLNEPEARLQQMWSEMSQDIIQNLYASIPDRIASCIHARGVSTGY